MLYRGEKYLEQCLTSLLAQKVSKGVEYEIVLRDNSPHNEAEQYIKKKLPHIAQNPRITIFSEKTPKNLWHSGGHNFLISKMSQTSEVYICASNDMLYEKNFLQHIRESFQNNSEYSVLTGKILQWNFERQNPDLREKTNIIDSCGLGIEKKHHFFDRYQGKIDDNTLQQQKIFGSSGAVFAIKTSALEAIQFENKKTKERGYPEYFDELLHYKNDIDLAYRLFWAGEKCLFIPEILAYHDRQVGEKSILKKIQETSFSVQKSSFLGQILVIKKNVCMGKFFPSLKNFSLSTQFLIFSYLFQYILFHLISRPSLGRELIFFWKHKKEISQKIQQIQQRKMGAEKNSGKFSEKKLELEKFFT